MHSHSSHMQSRVSILSKDLLVIGSALLYTIRDFMDVQTCFSFTASIVRYMSKHISDELTSMIYNVVGLLLFVMPFLQQY